MSKEQLKFRSRYDGTDRKGSIAFPPPEKNEMAAKQSFKDECDINRIMAKYRKTGELPSLIRADARYGDFADAPTYHEAMNTIHMAQEQFQALPAETRERFANNPENFLKFVHDPANAGEMVRMGLATARPVAEPVAPQKGAPKDKPKAKDKTPPSESSEE